MRSHQRAMDEKAIAILAQKFAGNSLTLDCTPGGGKTGAAAILANRLLDAGYIDRVLWVVPRISLAEQVVDAFATGPWARQGRQLNVADAEDNLFADALPNMPVTVGHVTTYQAVAAKGNKWQRFRDAVASRRVLLVLDEVQFLNDDSREEVSRGWHAKVKAVKDAAAFVLVMTGTLWRTDNKRIPFIEYEKHADGFYYPLAHVSYSLREAVRERAILPTEWRLRNGTVEYTHNGDTQLCDLLNDDDEEESRKVRTFLSGEKAVHGILDHMVCDWREWRRNKYQSRMIVMADDQKAARRWRDYLASKHSIPCVLATHKEESAGRKLRHFRERKHGQCLVTVAMAYVGFDCPDLTHLAYLSATRATSWMLQSFARVSRYDAGAPLDYDSQHAFVYSPDDERMRRFMDWVRQETAMGVMDQQAGRGPKAPSEDIIDLPADDFTPIDATPGGLAIESLYRRLSPDVEARLEAFVKTCPAAADMPRSKLFEILSSAGIDLTTPGGRNGQAIC